MPRATPKPKVQRETASDKAEQLDPEKVRTFIAALRAPPAPWLAFRAVRVAVSLLKRRLCALDLARVAKRDRRQLASFVRHTEKIDATLVRVWMTNHDNEGELIDARFIVDRSAELAERLGREPTRHDLVRILEICGHNEQKHELFAQVDQARRRWKAEQDRSAREEAREEARADKAEKQAREAIRKYVHAGY